METCKAELVCSCSLVVVVVFVVVRGISGHTKHRGFQGCIMSVFPNQVLVSRLETLCTSDLADGQGDCQWVPKGC